MCKTLVMNLLHCGYTSIRQFFYPSYEFAPLHCDSHKSVQQESGGAAAMTFHAGDVMNLANQLSKLETAEIVRRASDSDLSYLFKHALTQDSAYASLLKTKRRHIHLQVAQAIEAQYAEQLESFVPLLAQHYAEAGYETNAFHYSIRAGDAGSRIYANAEAILLKELALAQTGRGFRVGPSDATGGALRKTVSPAARRNSVAHVRTVFQVSERRACRVLGMARSSQRYRAERQVLDSPLTQRIIELATQYGQYGYRRITALLQREDWAVNHKRVEQIWRQEGLRVPAKQPKRRRLWLNDGSCVRLRPEYRGYTWSYVVEIA